MALKTTLLLDTLGWDLVLDTSGNIALATTPYAQAQDAASAIRLFQGELWYDTVPGVPYWASILGKFPPPVSLMKDQFNSAAKTVPGVVSATCFLTSAADIKSAPGSNAIGSFIIGVSAIGGLPTEASKKRQINGQVQIVTESGQTAAVAF